MESIGQKLRSTREGLNLTIDQVATETNISKYYLIAIENETYDELPGETYLLGFLRNYSDYLGLNPEEIVNLYKNFKIQEEPTPIEDLLNKKRKPKPLFLTAIVFLVLILAAVVIFYIYPTYLSNFFDNKKAQAETIEEKPETPKNSLDKIDAKNVYVFSDEVVEKRFKKGEVISVVYKDKTYPVIISNISDSVTLSCPQGDIIMKEESEELIDLDGNNTSDIRILLRSFDTKQSSLILHLDRFVQDIEPASNAKEEKKDEKIIPDNEKIIENPIDSSNPNAIVLKKAAKPEPFTLNVTFNGYCFFRYETNTGDRKEKYFHKGEILRLNVNTSVTLWASNAGVFNAKVDGIDLNLGAVGEVSAKTLKWNNSETGSGYTLELISID